MPIRTLHHCEPESSVHVTEMIIYDLFLFNIPLATTRAMTIANLSFMSVLGVIYFHFRHMWYEKKRKPILRQFMSAVSGACVMSITVS